MASTNCSTVQLPRPVPGSGVRLPGQKVPTGVANAAPPVGGPLTPAVADALWHEMHPPTW